MMIINTTPHPINFRNEDGGEFEVKTHCIINAGVKEKTVKNENGIEFVKTVFVPTEEGWEQIRKIKEEFGNDVIIVGSIIAAQAYPGEIVAMTPAKGFERVPPAEKRMNPKKFTTFE